MDQNNMRSEQEDLNAAASEEASAQESMEEASAQESPEEASAAPQDTEQQPQSGEGVSFTAEAESQADTGEAPADGAEEPKQPKKDLKLTLALAAVIALLAVAAIFLASKLKNNGADLDAAPGTEGESTAQTDAADTADGASSTIAHQNSLGFTSYTMTEEQATAAVLDEVVATSGSWSLTNRMLGFYFWQQYSNMYQQYGQYLSYIVQSGVGLDEQTLYNDESTTWQQFFLENALNNFGVIAAVVQDAEKNGFVLSEDLESQIEAMRDTLESSAVSYGYANADAFLQDMYGAAANLEDYLDFVRENTIAYAYRNEKTDAIEVSVDDLSAFYDEHAEEYQANGLEKLDKPMVNVRHILIKPEDPDGTGEYTDEAWAAAKEEADRIYAEWEASDMTEETFAEMANEYSADSGSNTNGGLYEGVYPGQMVTEFNDWCFDDARSVSDYDIVKTSYGYHIMFYVGVQDEIYWQTVVRSDYLTSQWTDMQTAICASYPLEYDLTKAGILNISLFETQETDSSTDSDTQNAELATE